MFDFSFSELALIGVVALVVIGPERLPRVARTAGVVAGRLQRYASAVRADIQREVEMSELRRVQDEIQDAARSFESGVRDTLVSAESQLEAGRQALMTGPQPASADLAAGAPASDLAPGTPSTLAVADTAPAPDLPLQRIPPGGAPATAGEPVAVAVSGPEPAPPQASLFAAAELPPGESAAPAPSPGHP